MKERDWQKRRKMQGKRIGLTKKTRTTAAALAAKATVLIYGVMFLIFFAYMVALNNAQLILYSFLGFLAFSLVLAIKDKYAYYSAFAAITIIISSNLLYFQWFGSLIDYYLALLVFGVCASVTGLMRNLIEKKYAIAAMFAIAMPLLLDVLKFGKAPALDANVAILGYYLFTSAILAIVIKIVYEGNWKRRGIAAGNAKRTYEAAVNPAIYLWAIIGVVLLIAPIYPLGISTPISGQPYATMSLSGFQKANMSADNNLYYMKVNLSNYKELLNPVFSNMRFYYTNGTPITAYISQSDDYYQNTPEVVLELNNKTGNYTNIRIYFMPYNTSYGRALTLIAPSTVNKITYKRINASLGAIENTGKYKNLTVLYSGMGIRNYTKQINYTLAPYYITYTICGPIAEINASASAKVSIFALHHWPNVPNLVYGWSSNQENGYYIGELSNLSYYTDINVTSSQTVLHNYNNTCTYYMVVSGTYTKLHIHYGSSYYGNVSYNVTLYVPNSIAQDPHYSYGFLPSSLSYLTRYYINETTPIALPYAHNGISQA